ncbi:MAG: hypothetical protein R2734_00475 [Nocardioides sp.]
MTATWELAGRLTRNGWSPDGRRLLVAEDRPPPSCRSRARHWGAQRHPRPGSRQQPRVLGWTGDSTALLWLPAEGGSAARIATLDLGSGVVDVVSGVRSGWSGAGVGQLSVATGLSRDLRVGPPVPVDRGPVPWRWWVLAGLLVVAGGLVARAVLARALHRTGSLRW